MEGTIRYLEKSVGSMAKAHIKLISESIAAAHGCSVEVEFEDLNPPTINHYDQAATVQEIAKEEVGEDLVGDFGILPAMASEDFSRYLERVPGCYLFISIGETKKGLHTSEYEFNDRIIPIGSKMFCRILEERAGFSFII
jgi:hippurate hydrolase